MSDPATKSFVSSLADPEAVEGLRKQYHKQIHEILQLTGEEKIEEFMDLLAVMPNNKQSIMLLADLIADMPATDQLSVYKRLGGDPAEAEARYPELKAKSEELRKKNEVAGEKVRKWRNRTFWITFAGILALPEKIFGAESRPEKYILKAIYAALGGFFAFVGANLVFTRIFTGSNFGADEFGAKPREGSIRAESLILARKSQSIFTQRELPDFLAAALNKRSQEMPPEPVMAANAAPPYSAQVCRAQAPQPRDSSYVAEAAKPSAPSLAGIV